MMRNTSLTVSLVILSQNPPKKLLEEIAQQTYQPLEVIIASEPGIVNAMNRALNRAKGDIFARIDDDVMLPKKWLEELVNTFFNDRIGGVTGPTYVPPFLRKNRDSIKAAEHPNWFLRWMFDGDPFAPAKIYKCGSVSYGSNFWEHIDQNKLYDIDHLEGTNWAMFTTLIKQVGGFDPKFDGVAEWYDTDVEFKIKKLGYKLAYNPKAWLWHLPGKGAHYSERFAGWGRIKNWLRFHVRHSEFHLRKIVWLTIMICYFLIRRIGDIRNNSHNN